MSRWFRHYAGMMRDEKLVRVAVQSKQPVERVVWIWGAILESAAEVNDGGKYEIDAGEVAYFLRCDASDIDRILSGLADIGRIVQGVVARWSDRQFESDSSKERQRRYRQRKADPSFFEENDHDRGGDDEGASRDGDVTPQENRDIEQKEDASASSKRERAIQFDVFWSVYPRKVGKGRVPQALSSALRKASFDEIMAGARRYASERAGQDAQFTKHPATWLNGEHWSDEPAPIPKPRTADPPPSRPRNAGELARMQLREMGQLPDAADNEKRHLRTSDGSANPPVTGLARRFAITASR